MNSGVRLHLSTNKTLRCDIDCKQTKATLVVESQTYYARDVC